MEQLITTAQDLFTGMTTDMSVFGIAFLGWLFIVLCLALVFFFRIYIAYYMAKKRHRDPLGWALFSFFVSPILTWIILLIAGDSRD